MDKRAIYQDNIITSEEIRLILDRYRIGKKPLAKLLGWGETTIIRYMDGDIPTSEYSNKLYTIMNFPEYYYDLLQKRKDCLTSVAYRKSKNAVIGYIMSSKIYAVAYYIINRSNADISARYLQYLLYYGQVFSLTLKDKELFQEECSVNSDYIPYWKLYEGMKQSGIRTLEFKEEYLTPEERELIDTVYNSFTWYGPRALQAFAIYDKPNMKISRDQYNNRIFSKETLKAYYKGILERYQMESIKDITRFPEIRMQELKEL
jgi:uncharacterized phage-associated protein